MASKDYWHERFGKIYKENSQNRRIKKMYRDSMKRMKKEIDYLYYKLKDGKPLTRTELYKFSHFLSLKKCLKQECEINTIRLQHMVESVLKKTYRDTFKTVNYLFHNNSPFSMVDKEKMKAVLNTNWSGKHFSKRIWNNQEALSKDIEKTIIDCIVNGKSKNEAIRHIQLLNNSTFFAAETLVRTEMSHVATKACLNRYKDLGCEEVEILSERKKRTCEHCKKMHGKKFKIDKAKIGVDLPPYHPRCFCDIIPVVNLKD